MRIEDLDTGRVRERFTSEQLADLAALGLDWDGAVVRQSERPELYDDALEPLAATGLVYPCWCTRAEIREAASAPHGDLPEGAYPGTCRRLTGAERAARRAEGRPPALRVRAGAASVTFEDAVAGTVTGVVDDFVVRRNDGAYAYNLAVVVDDADQGIGEVVRGADLLDSTPRQLWLGERLGLPAPRPRARAADARRRRRAAGQAPRRGHARRPRRARRDRRTTCAALLAASVGLREPGEAVTPAELVERFSPAVLAADSGGGAMRMRLVRIWLPVAIVAGGLIAIVATGGSETGVRAARASSAPGSRSGC